jgi:voltage-gated potassium channel
VATARPVVPGRLRQVAAGPVTGGTGPGPGARRAARPSRRMIVRAVLRIVGSITALVALYYLLPLDRSSAGGAITILVIGLAVFIALVAFQVRSIIRSPFPGLRAIEGLATSVPLFLLLFASSYVVMAAMSAGNFGGRLTHTDGLYFTVTVFSTVGFGDITAKTQAARLVVTGQMISDLVVLGLAIKVIMGAVSRRRQPGDSGGT